MIASRVQMCQAKLCLALMLHLLKIIQAWAQIKFILSLRTWAWGIISLLSSWRAWWAH